MDATPGRLLERSRQLLVEELCARAELADRSLFVPPPPPSAAYALVVRLGIMTLWQVLLEQGHELPLALGELLLESALELEAMRFKRESAGRR